VDSTNKTGDSRENLLSAFLAMPWLLKLITLNAACGVPLVLATIVGPPIYVGSNEISTSEWWASGAGVLVALAMIPVSASALLMLRRSARARKLYVSSVVLLSLTTPVAAYLTTKDITTAFYELAFLLLLFAFIAGYLYFNRGVRDYFERTPARTSIDAIRR